MPTAPATRSSPEHPNALLIIPSYGTSLDPVQFETMLQALALPTHRPWLRLLGWRGLIWSPRGGRTLFALELVGSAHSQAFVVRAARPAVLSHLATQLQARLPTARILSIPAATDPFALRQDEAVSVYELRRGGAETYLPLRVSEPHHLVRDRGSQSKLDTAGIDPLLGLLAALSTLPQQTRVVFQLALAAAPEGWSRGYEQSADQHSLYQNRSERHQQQPDVLHDQQIFLLPVIMAGAVLVALWHRAAMGQRPATWVPARLRQIWNQLVVHFTNSSASAGGRTTANLARLWPEILLTVMALALLSLVARASWSLLASVLLPRPAPIYDTGLVAQKTQQIAYHSVLRLYAISPAGSGNAAIQTGWRDWRRQILDQATAGYRQFHTANAGYFKPHHLRSRQARRLLPHVLLPDPVPADAGGDGVTSSRVSAGSPTSWTRGVSRSSQLLTVAEIAMLWHLPREADLAHVPFLQDVAAYHSRLAPRDLFSSHPGLEGLDGVAPKDEPGYTMYTPHEERLLRRLAAWPGSAVFPQASATSPPQSVLGVSRHAGYRGEVRVTPDMLGRHTLAIGGTGKGKSSLLLALARSWLGASFQDEPLPGLVLLDPHGDLASAFLRTVPSDRQEDVMVLDLADTDYPFGLNPLDVTLGRSRDKACEDLMAIFQHIWESSWGYRMEDIWKASLKTLFEANETLVDRDPEDGPDQQYTLVDVAALLSNTAFRRLVLTQIKDLELRLWWQRFATWDKRFQAEATLPVLNKVGNFGGSKVSRRVLGQSRSTIDLAAALGSGRIIVVHTADNIVGSDTGALVGATILGLVRMALGGQAYLSKEARRRTQVVIDEFQAVPGANYAEMLSQLRKFGGVYVLATQSLAYLDRLGPTLRATVLSNISNLFAFGMSAEDARMIAPELDGTIIEQDLINLEDFTCYARLTQAGQRLRTFSLALAPPPGGSAAQEDTLRAMSRKVVGRPQASVEQNLELAMRRRLSPGWEAAATPRQHAGEDSRLPEDEPPDWRDVGEDGGFLTADLPNRGKSAGRPPKPPGTRRRSTAADRQMMGRGATRSGDAAAAPTEEHTVDTPPA